MLFEQDFKVEFTSFKVTGILQTFKVTPITWSICNQFLSIFTEFYHINEELDGVRGDMFELKLISLNIAACFVSGAFAP